MRVDRLPQRFVWTRIGAEAGQTAAAILARKETERRASGGVFAWGIGSALGTAARELASLDAAPLVFFSPMLSAAATHDERPSAVIAWTAYHGSGSLHALPAGCIVTSRAHTAAGALKTAHYALLCGTPVDHSSTLTIDSASLRNLATGGNVGASQVTAVVQVSNDAGGRRYGIAMVAALRQPYAVRLARPVTLDEETRSAITSAGKSGEAALYLALANELGARGRADAPLTLLP